eukprot:CAMPEP_0206559458 /NCGR_PEP_ID=MMETSP0325_2-20121206/20406_1 /ASSEMBLY_ACC=CAM_ASM_000347 /TAXON_ID=2866 /ORGANISM="Crypthecodinium cohnii, Strain Seligo" /LENGTH=346 /DNA_ID=CAMNT_0054060963 /DNA_START=14 /DNA_END=1054 /DNA_ORIENTATION=+
MAPSRNTVAVLLLLLPLVIGALIAFATFIQRRRQQRLWQEEQKKRKEKANEEIDTDPTSPVKVATKEELKELLEKEAWAPKLDLKDWSEASEFPGCPWNFECCQGLDEVLEKIWKQPLPTELQSGYKALAARIKSVRVARVKATLPTATHFVIVYTLMTGAELFGGAPIEHAVGLTLDNEEETTMSNKPDDGLRRRRGAARSVGSKGPAHVDPDQMVPDMLLPAMLPFYRIHDGFGVLLSTGHLPLLLSSPTEGMSGSCFYVYPSRGLELEVARGRPLVRFARVDKTCSACAEHGVPRPVVVYLEKTGEQTEDDECPLDFIGDTISNVAGQRVVPPSYMGGPSSSS